MNENLLIVNDTLNITWACDNLIRLSGLTMEELADKYILEFIASDDVFLYLHGIDKLQQGLECTIDITLENKQKVGIPSRVNAKPIQEEGFFKGCYLQISFPDTSLKEPVKPR